MVGDSTISPVAGIEFCGYGSQASTGEDTKVGAHQ